MPKSPEITLAPRLEELKSKIDKNKVLDAQTIDAANITDLFKPLLGTDMLGLTDLSFHTEGENTLLLKASTSFYTKTVSVRATFELSGTDLNLLLDNQEDGLSFTLQDLVKDGLIPSSITYPVDSWPKISIDGVYFVLNSSTSSMMLQTSTGAHWDFLGYESLYIAQPGINVMSTVVEGVAYQTVEASGTLESADQKVSIKVNIQLPVGYSGWGIGLGAPIDLSSALDVLDAIFDKAVSSLLPDPDKFSKMLSAVLIKAFSVKFDPTTKTIYQINLQVETADDWVIVKDKLKLDAGITVSFNAIRYKVGDPFSYSGSISGSAIVNYGNESEKIVANASIPIPLFGKDWRIALGNTEDEISLTRLIGVVPLAQDILPKGLLDQLDKIVVDSLAIRFKFDSGTAFSFTHVSFKIHSDKTWQLPMLQNVVYLDELQFELDVSFPYSNTTTSGNLSGNIQLGGGMVTIPVSIAKARSDMNWLLNVTSESIPLPSISDLSDFMGLSVLESASPSGLMGIGNFEINNLNLKWLLNSGSKLELLEFTVASTPETVAWNLVPGYFALNDLSISLKIVNVNVSQKDISGSIGATVNFVLSENEGENLELGMTATKPASDKPWNFSGSLKKEIDLEVLLGVLQLPKDVTSILPKLTVRQFDLTIEPTSKSFSTSIAIKSSDQWPLFTVGSTDIILQELYFGLEHYANNTNLEARGKFDIGSEAAKAFVEVSALYQQKIWNFKGSFTNTEKVTINQVLEKFIPGINSESIPQVSIDNILVDFEKGPITNPPAAVEDYTTLDFSINGTLSIPVIQSMSIEAAVHLLYDSRKSPENQYDGTQLNGTLRFGGLSFAVFAKLKNKEFEEYTFEISYRKLTAQCVAVPDGDKVKFDFKLISEDNNRVSLGDVIATLIEAATGEAPEIPSPWNFINKIPLSGFHFVFTYDKSDKSKTFSLTYPTNINLGFITVDELSLTYAPNADQDQGPVQFAVTKGTFLGFPIDGLAAEEKPAWDLRKPEEAPPVPGLGDAAFRLENLSLGNQVAIQDGKTPKSVVEAIDELTAAFDPDGKAALQAQKQELPGTLRYDKNYGWLIGAKFTLIRYIDIAVIFYDPVIYGLSIGVSGGKFEGLDFQILYKKVSDSVGVYQIDLTLPDFVRKQQFGAVSVTLPSISLSIFTNGDFLIDMGFPHNGDFSRSFGLEVTIFTGAGGFYFGKLSNDSAADFNLPEADGQFNPVIAFGIGIRAGVGRTVDKGILKAELSLTLQVILEGIISFYEANKPPSKEIQGTDGELYFRVQAQAGLVGRIYGEINFVIVVASVDITAKVLADLVLEAYRKTELTFTAAVSASVKVRVNLGLFKVTVNCSYSTTISDSFTLGSDSKAPWDSMQLPDRSAFFTALDVVPSIEIPEMNWKASMTYDKEAISLLFLPQLSVQYKDGATNQRRGVGVSLLFINNKSNSGEATDFTRLSRAMLAWTFNAYFSKKAGKADQILDQKVTIDDLNAIYAYLNQKKFATDVEPFGREELIKYFFEQSFTSVTLNTQNATSQKDLANSDQDVAMFPMFPIFEMTVTGQAGVDFMQYGPVDSDYLKEIKNYFEEMKVQFNKEQDPVAFEYLNDATPATLAEYLFIDYFVMMAKSGIQDAINDFKEIQLEVEEGDSVDDIVRRYADYGVRKEEFAFNNRHQSLRAGAKVTIPSFVYRLRTGESVQHLVGRLPELPQESLLNEDGSLVEKSKTNWIRIPSFTYQITDRAQHSLWSVAQKFNIEFDDLLTQNSNTSGLFEAGTKLLHAFTEGEGITVREILDYLQSGQKFSLSNIGGTVSRFFLHGLRIPDAVGSSTRIGLYEATGQQFVANKLAAGDAISLKMNQESSKPEWLKFSGNGEVHFDFNADMVTAVQTLENATYVPTLQLDTQEDTKRYKIQAKTFSLPLGIEWKNPNLEQAGDELTESYIWKFPSKLQQYLLDYPNLAFDLLLQSRKTSFTLAESESVTPLFWGTSVQVKIRQIPSPNTPDEPLAFVYEVQGCGEADAQLLRDIINIDDASIKHLDILFGENKSKNNGGEEVYGLISNSLVKFKTFLLQTNYSTASNPDALFAIKDESVQQATNLVGMDAKTFITYLWDCSIVRSGGYYLSYNDGLDGGLPSDLFDEDGLATITVLLSYDISAEQNTSAYKLPTYVNNVVLNKKIDPKKDNLYLEVHLNTEEQKVFNPDVQTIEATILPGTGLFKGHRVNPQLLSITNLTESGDAQLSELFNLLEYRINASEGEFIETKFALPVGPTVEDESGVNSISAAPRLAKAEDGWIFKGVTPIYPFVASALSEEETTSEDILQSDPYGANGKTATVYFNFLDVFGNTLTADGSNSNGSGIELQITPGYLDPVISLDQWVNVAKYYDIAQGIDSGNPELTIHLGFDTGRYDIDTNRVDLAKRDVAFFQNVYWQLKQKDLKVNVHSTIGALKEPTQSPLTKLKQYVNDIIQYLDTIIHPIPAKKRGVNAPTPLIPGSISLILETRLQFEIDTSAINQEYIFALEVILEIERTNHFDPQFANEPGIRFASAVIPVDLYQENEKENDTSEPSALDAFAKKLEGALPVMKVAVGQAKPKAKSTTTWAEKNELGVNENKQDKEIWLVRYAGDTQEPGIKLSVNSDPVYFSTKPLSTKLISRPNELDKRPVPLREYTTGTYLGGVTPVDKAYASIDIEVLARTFVMVMDEFLSADMSTLAWNTQYNDAVKAAKQPSPESTPFQIIEQAKKDIAHAIAYCQLTNILKDENISGLEAAQEALEQQLLISLEKAYSINAVMQNKVTVEEGYDKPTANFYGQLESASAKIPGNAYSFTPIKVPLDKATGEVATDSSTITSMFSVRQESGKDYEENIDLIANFKAELYYNVTNIEHNFGEPINGYIPSSWLTLARPIKLGDDPQKPLIHADIPIPLKAYPTAPSMVKQSGTATYSNDIKINGKDELDKVLSWNYAFNYDYIAAQQDKIYLNIRFNVQSGSPIDAADAELDLFEALTQFNHSYKQILNDIREEKDALIALQSFAWMTQQVGNAWSTWFDKKTELEQLAKHELDFTIREFESEDEMFEDYLMLEVVSTSGNPAGTLLPGIEIDGFDTKVYKPEEKHDKNITYYFVNEPTQAPLLFTNRKKYSQRNVKLAKHNILKDENAWAGISIHRNEKLADKDTNDAFKYETPYIRFVEPCLPSIYNESVINLADFNVDASQDNKVKLEVILEKFFEALFTDVKDPEVILQMKFGYQFPLQPDGGKQLTPLGPTLPILLTTPTNTAWKTPPPFLGEIATAVKQWMGNHKSLDVSKNQDGELRIVLSLYSSLTPDIHNPILKLNGLFVKTNLIDFD